MKENYKTIGSLVELLDERNSDGKVNNLIGVSIDKCFIKSVANTIGTDLSKYQVIRKNDFACSLMQVSRDGKIPIACLKDYDIAIMSPAYHLFRIKDTSEIMPEYMAMWFVRPEFDREAAYIAVGGVRGSMPWEDFCKMKLPVPSITEQQKLVDAYNAIENRIQIKKKINEKLEETAQAVFKDDFINNPDPVVEGTLSNYVLASIGGDWGKDSPEGNNVKEVSCIRGADMLAAKIGLTENAPVRYILPKNYETKQIKEHDFIVEISGGSPTQSTGRIIYISPLLKKHCKRDLICSNFCRVLRVKKEAIHFFYCYWTYLYNNSVMFNYENSSTGLKNFDLDIFINTEKIRISKEEKIVSFGKKIEPVLNQIMNNGIEIEKLIKLKQLLITRLSGM